MSEDWVEKSWGLYREARANGCECDVHVPLNNSAVIVPSPRRCPVHSELWRKLAPDEKRRGSDLAYASSEGAHIVVRHFRRVRPCPHREGWRWLDDGESTKGAMWFTKYCDGGEPSFPVSGMSALNGEEAQRVLNEGYARPIEPDCVTTPVLSAVLGRNQRFDAKAETTTGTLLQPTPKHDGAGTIEIDGVAVPITSFEIAVMSAEGGRLGNKEAEDKIANALGIPIDNRATAPIKTKTNTKTKTKPAQHVKSKSQHAKATVDVAPNQSIDPEKIAEFGMALAPLCGKPGLVEFVSALEMAAQAGLSLAIVVTLMKKASASDYRSKPTRNGVGSHVAQA